MLSTAPPPFSLSTPGCGVKPRDALPKPALVTNPSKADKRAWAHAALGNMDRVPERRKPSDAAAVVSVILLVLLACGLMFASAKAPPTSTPLELRR